MGRDSSVGIAKSGMSIHFTIPVNINFVFTVCEKKSFALKQCFLDFLARGPLLASKSNHGPHIFADVNTDCPDGS